MIIEILQQMLNGLAIGSVYTVIALGLTVVFGILGIAHFAHGSVAMSGGYLTYLFGERLAIGFFPAMALAMLVGAVIGLLIERLAYRPVRDAPHINAFIIALGLTMMVEGINLLTFGADQVVIQTPYRGVFNVGGVAVAELRLLVILTACTLIGVVALLISRTKTGKSIRAVAQNRPAAVLMGVNVNRVSAIVFSVSSALGAAAGALVGFTAGSIMGDLDQHHHPQRQRTGEAGEFALLRDRQLRHLPRRAGLAWLHRHPRLVGRWHAHQDIQGQRLNSQLQQTNTSGTLGLQLAETLRFDLDWRYYQAEVGNPGSVFANDADDNTLSEFWSLSPRLTWETTKRWTQTLTYQMGNFRQVATGNTSPFGPFDNRITSRNHFFEYQSVVRVTDKWTLTAGAWLQDQSFNRYNDAAPGFFNPGGQSYDIERTGCNGQRGPPGFGRGWRGRASRPADCVVLPQRQRDLGGQAAAVARQQFEFAAVAARDAIDDRQAQARSLGVAAGGVEPGERPLHALDLGRGDAGAAVADREQRRLAVVLQADLDRFAFAGVAQRVVDQVDEQPAQGQRPAPQRRYRRQAGGQIDAAPEVGLGHLRDQRLQDDLAARFAAARGIVLARELEKLADDLVHLVDVAFHFVARRLVFAVIPATPRKHVSVGVGYALSPSSPVDFAWSHAFQENMNNFSQPNTSAPIRVSAQDNATLVYTYRF